MSSKPKKLIIIIALVALLGILAGTLWFLKNRDKSASSDANKSVSADNTDVNLVFESDEAEILFLSVIYEGDKKTFFVDDDGVWKLSGEHEFPLDSSAITLMLTTLKNVTASYRYDGIDDLSQYGLDAPSVSIIVDMGDDPVTISVGDQYPLGSGRYVSVSDIPGTVFVAPVEIYSRFAKTRLELLQTYSMPYIATSEITEISFDAEGYGAYDLVSDPSYSFDNTGCYPWTILTEDMEHVTVDVDKLNTLFTNATSFTFTSTVDYLPENKPLYGIDENSGHIRINYTIKNSQNVTDENGEKKKVTTEEDKEICILLGDDAGDGYTYASVEGEDFVYKLSTARIADLAIEDPYEYESDKPFMIRLGNIHSVTMITADYSHYYSTEYEFVADEETGEMTVAERNYLDGELLDEAENNRFQGNLLDLTELKCASTRLNRGDDIFSYANGQIMFEVYYETLSGSIYNVRASEYDDSYYIAVVDNERAYRIDKRDMNTLIEAFR